LQELYNQHLWYGSALNLDLVRTHLWNDPRRLCDLLDGCQYKLGLPKAHHLQNNDVAIIFKHIISEGSTVASVKVRTSPVTRGSVRYFRTVTSVAHFRVIASEVVFGVNFLAISRETLRCAQHLTNLFMFLYQKGVRSQKFSHQVTLSAVHWQVAPLHQPLSPTTSSVVPGGSSSPRTLFSERHFWGAVRTLTLATVQEMEKYIVFVELHYRRPN
jgi:hypothetical protein